MATAININGSLTLDQSSGQQDNDVLIGSDLSGLSAAFSAFLGNLAAVGANTLSANQLDFADDVEAVVSGANYVTVTPNSAEVNDLFFSDADGNALDGDQVFLPNGVTPLQTIDGDDVFLWSFGDIVIATTSNDPNDKGDVVAAFYLNESADHLSASIEYVSFIPFAHPDDEDPDDTIDFTDILNISAATEVVFDFADLPSGQNLFGIIPADKSALDGDALLVMPGNVVLNDDGTFSTSQPKSGTVNTSKGGGPVTIGNGNQMIDPGESMRFAYIVDPEDSFVAGVTDGLDQNEADNADNIQFVGTTPVSGAEVEIVQVQGSKPVKMEIKAWDIDLTSYDDNNNGKIDGEEGRDFAVNPLIGAVQVNINEVTVSNATGTVIFHQVEGAAPDVNTAAITADFSGASVILTNLGQGYSIEFLTASPHDLAEIIGKEGAFDIGGFNLTEGQVITTPVGDKLFVDDDGPTAALDTTAAVLTLDETDNDGVDDFEVGPPLADVTTPIATLFDDTSEFGTDGPKDFDDPEDGTDDDATTYSLVLNGVNPNSGLVDTLSGEAIFLFQVDDFTIEGRVGSGGLADAGGAVAFSIIVSNDPDTVQVIQDRAVVHDDPDDPDESDDPESIDPNLVLLRVTVIDDDGDPNSDDAELGSRINFEDDGPSIERNVTAVPTLTTDDTDIPDVAGPTDFSVLFDTAFGQDGFKDSDDNDVEDDDAITYALGVKDLGGADVDSGVDDTLTGDNILLRLDVDGNVEGYLENDTSTLAFEISVDQLTGEVTLTQFRAVVHDDPNDPQEDGAGEPTTLASADLVTLTATATDGDGDTDDVTADIGGAFQFLDDGPSISRNATAVPTLTTDDTDVPDNDSADFSVLFDADFGEDDFKDSDDNDVEDDDAITYALDIKAPDVDSGVNDTLTGDNILLRLDVDGNVEGYLENDTGTLAFEISVDELTGEVTLTQFRAVVHDDPNDPQEDGAGEPTTLASADLVTLTATATDGDGDTDDVTADIGDAFQFLDDGPVAAITDTGEVVVHDESAGEQTSGIPNPDTGEDNDDDDQPLANLPAAFAALGAAIGWAANANAVVTSAGTDFGTDGEAATDSQVWSLDVPAANTDSGFFDLDGNKILLNVEDGIVVGRISSDGLDVVTQEEADADLTGTLVADPVAIAIMIDQNGILSTAQYVPFQHPTDDPDEAVVMNDNALLAVLTVTDGDGDGHVDTEAIGDKVVIEDDGPIGTSLATRTLEEDDLDSPPTLSQGNDLDGTDGQGDGSGTRHTATIAVEDGVTSTGVDQPVSFNIKTTDPNTILPDLFSQGVQLSYVTTLEAAPGVDQIEAFAGARLVWTFTLQDFGDGTADAVLTLNDQLDHVPVGDNVEGNLLMTDQADPDNTGGTAIDQIDFTDLLVLLDADGDPVSLGDEFLTYEVFDDTPVFTADIQGGTVDFEAGDSITRSLNGSVGTDDNDADNLSGDGSTKTYTFASFTESFLIDVNGNTVWDAGQDTLIRGVLSADGTMVQYFEDLDGDDTTDDFGDQFHEITLDQTANDGAGSYTFETLKDPPPAFLEFDFTDLPSGQNLHGTIAADKSDLDGLGLLVFPEGAVLDADGTFTNASSTLNTSKGGGPVTIGNGNQMIDPGEGMFFVYVDNPDDDAVAGVTGGLTQNTADDADVVGFADTFTSTTSSVEIVQVQGGGLVSLDIFAYDITLDTPPLGDAAGESQDFVENPLDAVTSNAPKNITEVKVIDGETLIFHATEGGGVIVDLADVTADFSLGDEVRLGGIDDNYTIEFTTDGAHDLVLVEGVDGKFDIGGFNISEAQPTPDQVYEFEVAVTDFDGDSDTSNPFSVTVDGTGPFDSGEFEDGTLVV